jgi:hypothetical protein
MKVTGVLGRGLCADCVRSAAKTFKPNSVDERRRRHLLCVVLPTCSPTTQEAKAGESLEPQEFEASLDKHSKTMSQRRKSISLFMF